mmetsp:Transcript_31743/g.51562  ORF Transcript_31743/g.51562 Transcript_31743/m.51562 type:complete len:102 (+) Transcript_31743:267-572(+)
MTLKLIAVSITTAIVVAGALTWVFSVALGLKPQVVQSISNFEESPPVRRLNFDHSPSSPEEVQQPAANTAHRRYSSRKTRSVTRHGTPYGRNPSFHELPSF